jgi:hypothetical protein
MSDLPANVYRVAQRRFDAISGSPWVYWISGGLRGLFDTLPCLNDVAQPRQGLATADNFRFIRSWWEIPPSLVGLRMQDLAEAKKSGYRWFPHTKGKGPRWYHAYREIINWYLDGVEMKVHIVRRYPYLDGKWEWVLKNSEYYLRPGLAYSAITGDRLFFRLQPVGHLFDCASDCVFLEDENWRPLYLMGILNSKLIAFFAQFNATLNVNVEDLLRLPVPWDSEEQAPLIRRVTGAVRLQVVSDLLKETSPGFAVPSSWATGPNDLAAAQARLAALESQIDDEAYRLYGISDEDRAAIEAELAGEPLADEDDETEPATRTTPDDEEDTDAVEPPMTAEELAVRWISYAVGVVLGRFTIGDLRFTNDQPPIQNRQSKIGNAIYRREDFAVGSLPAPDVAEFDELVGPVERFAYVDADGGRHLFPAEVEAALRELAVEDGITVLDEGHGRDLPALVEQALQLMLDWDTDTQHARRNTHEVIEAGAGGDLRKFLERHFFTRWHFRWYRKRPVYWPLQSARRSYGFVLFHERVDRSTLYVLQRDYLDHKLNGLRLQIGDLRVQLEGKEGRARKQVERRIDQATQLLDEVTEFAQTMERVVREGYEPEPSWIDDGVILRMAPVWELIPIWKREPKKYWERLQRGDYDWSHIAMRYWPERVQEKCKENKSFAIAHGHAEWYEGD